MRNRLVALGIYEVDDKIDASSARITTETCTIEQRTARLVAEKTESSDGRVALIESDIASMETSLACKRQEHLKRGICERQGREGTSMLLGFEEDKLGRPQLHNNEGIEDLCKDHRPALRGAPLSDAFL